MFFSFDGLDGVGKTTQILQFADWLRAAGYEVVTCRDPGSTALGERLRDLLLNPASPAMSRRSEMFIYMAARAQLVDEVIRPALARGQVVISDRFLLANVVYQAHAGGMEPEDVWGVGKVAVDGTMPDLVFLLDLEVEAACQRRGRAPDRIEAQGMDYLRKVRDGFLTEARQLPQQVAVVDAAQTPEQIQQEIRRLARPWVHVQE